MQYSFPKNEMTRLRCYFQQIFATRLSKYQMIQVRLKGYYSVLGLDKTASAAEIKDAYYKLSFKYHPDRNEGSEASTAKFREICEAYETLSDKDKKEKYDNAGFRSYDPPRNPYDRNDPFNYRRPPEYRTGFREFDYEKHFREHYGDEYYRNRTHPIYHKRIFAVRKASGLLMVMWLMTVVFFAMSTLSSSHTTPPPPRPIYYNQSDTKEKGK